MNLLEGGKGGEGRMGERGWGGRVGERGRGGRGGEGRHDGYTYCNTGFVRILENLEYTGI